MKAEYIELIDGSKVRTQFNMNALTSFKEATGFSLIDISKSEGKDLTMLLKLAYACVIEGERLDGRNCDLSEFDFGGLMSVSNIVEFAKIFARQGFQAQSDTPEQRPPWWRQVWTRHR